MTWIDDGGQAFPRVGEGVGNPNYDVPGMSLRDWFAGQALTGMMAHPHCPQFETMEELRAYFANTSYAYADAMIAARYRAPSGR